LKASSEELGKIGVGEAGRPGGVGDFSIEILTLCILSVSESGRTLCVRSLRASETRGQGRSFALAAESVLSVIVITTSEGEGMLDIKAFQFARMRGRFDKR